MALALAKLIVLHLIFYVMGKANELSCLQTGLVELQLLFLFVYKKIALISSSEMYLHGSFNAGLEHNYSCIQNYLVFKCSNI